MSAMYLEVVQCLLHSLVLEVDKPPSLTTRTGLLRRLDLLYTCPAEVLSTAGGLVGLSEDVQTNGTLRYEHFRRRFNEFTVKARHFYTYTVLIQMLHDYAYSACMHALLHAYVI